MKPKKRSRTSDDVPLPPLTRLRSSRQSVAVPNAATALTTTASQAAPTATTAPTATRAPTAAIADTLKPILANEPDIANESDIANEPDNSQGSLDSQKSLSGTELSQQVIRMVKNRDRAELMILELMEEYSFSFPHLKELLRENNLEVSFSNVKYADIAQRVGLDPLAEGQDIPTFPMYRARLTNTTFQAIIQNIEDLSLQYGHMGLHKNEEARARFLSGFFNKTVALFSGVLLNTPETLLEGRITTKGRIEYQFKTFGGITVVFIEVKLNLGNSTERINFFAQVIAECDACAWMNFQNGFHVPIMAVLCDGNSFYFFKFVNRRQTRSADPQIFLGKFADGSRKQFILEWSPDTDPEVFISQARLICESLFYVFLSGYQSGLDAYWNRSVERGKKQGRKRTSTPGWHKAKVLAGEALKVATSAWDQRREDKEESRKSAERAFQLLATSAKEAPQGGITLMDHYTEEVAERL